MRPERHAAVDSPSVTTLDTAVPTTVVAPRRSVYGHLTQLWAYRELLMNLVRKELKVKYKNSTLGFCWSLLNPMMYLVVFYVVFQLVLGANVPYFAVFLLTGLLAWNLYSVSLGAATGSIVGNSSLVNKIYFPREILPLSTVGANIVHFFLQSLVLVAALAVFGLRPELAYVWLVLPALVVLLIFTSAMAIFLSAVNVYARDTQHLLELALLAWFWMTPIVYPWGVIAGTLGGAGLPVSLTLVNPMTSVVLAFQRGLYGITVNEEGGLLLPDASPLWYFRNLAIVGLIAMVLLALAIKLFGRLEANFAEEL
ncbi:N/A [soil metagenome]|jgi:ABC-2 type transport system permease protein